MTDSTPLISVVSPVYLGEDTVGALVERVTAELHKITDSYEIILVEDGSPDGSWEQIAKICKLDPHVRGIKLSRNFGQHQAITAGLDHAKGEWAVVMDCDLQDRPEEISNLYRRAMEGFEIVLARRITRQDSAIKRASSKLFYGALQYLTGISQDPLVANFGIYHRRVIDVLTYDMRESIRFFPMMVRWLGFDVATIDVAHAESARDSSAYSIVKLIDLAFNVMLTFSDKPLRLTVQFGGLITLTAAIYGVYLLNKILFSHSTVEGWTSLIVSIWFLGGFTIFVLGVIGLYLGRTFEQVKRRPIYVIQRRENE
jgi:glycosyltransferase involved in cell wall biosynthesis